MHSKGFMSCRRYTYKRIKNKLISINKWEKQRENKKKKERKKRKLLNLNKKNIILIII